jgi:subtilisin family serine protease
MGHRVLASSRSCLRLVLFFLLHGALMYGVVEAQTPVVVTTTVTTDAQGGAVLTVDDATPRYHPSRVLVRFRNGAAPSFLPGSPPALTFTGDRSLHRVGNPPGLSVAEVMRRYRGNPNVVYVEPDYEVRAIATPTDPRWSEQWDMVKISAPQAWDIPSQTNASDIVVAVIDTGVDFTHPDLQGNLWVDPTDTTSNGFTCIGPCARGGMDDHGHGTHVSGTIGAATNNGIGIAGINWNVQIMALKFLGSGGSGFISDAVLCFDKVYEQKHGAARGLGHWGEQCDQPCGFLRGLEPGLLVRDGPLQLQLAGAGPSEPYLPDSG